MLAETNCQTERTDVAGIDSEKRGYLWLVRSQLIRGRYKDNILVLRPWSRAPVQARERGVICKPRTES